MKTELKMIYWKSGKFWLGKFEEYPEIMTQGRTLKELEENLRDAYKMWVRPEPSPPSGHPVWFALRVPMQVAPALALRSQSEISL